MRRFAVCYLTCFVWLLGATPWKLVLKDGTTVECDGAPVVINDVYMFRSADGGDGSLPADQVDREQTNTANKVAPPPRLWRLIGQSVHQPSGDILAVNDANFDSEVLESKAPVMVEFWASWCGYCRKMEPTLQSVAGDYADRVKVYRLDIDKNPATAQRYGVHALPTLMLFNRGQMAGTLRGAADKSTVTRMLAGPL
ncbi:MAG TPA: thioredoxin [Bryobacteraceae bacterium]|nr:thioredoxin [Bryobacteraceae bacterium]